MQIFVPDAKGQLTELVRRAEKGDEIVLTRHGHAAVRLVPVKAPLDRKSRRVLLEAARAVAQPRRKPGRALPEARTSSMKKTGCHDDRCRHLGVDGDCARRAGG